MARQPKHVFTGDSRYIRDPLQCGPLSTRFDDTRVVGHVTDPEFETHETCTGTVTVASIGIAAPGPFSADGAWLVRGAWFANAFAVRTDSLLEEGSVRLLSGDETLCFWEDQEGSPAGTRKTEVTKAPPVSMNLSRTFWLWASEGGVTRGLSYSLHRPDGGALIVSNLAVEAVMARLSTYEYYVAYGSAAPLSVDLDPVSHDPAGYGVLVDGVVVACSNRPPFHVDTSSLAPGVHTVTVRCETFPDLEDSAELYVVKVDIDPAETNLAWTVQSASLHLSWYPCRVPDDTVSWSVSPSGLSYTPTSGDVFTFSPTNSSPGAYTVTASSTILPECATSCVARVIKVDFLEDATTDYNFSPSLGEAGTFKVNVSPPPSGGGYTGLSFKLQIVRETAGGGEQEIDWVDVDSDATPDSRPLAFDSLAFDWDGISSSSALQASGRDAFQGVSESATRVFPAANANQPVPPPFVTAVAKIVRDSDQSVLCEARKRVFIPQVVKLMYDTDAVAQLSAGIVVTNNGSLTVLLNAISEEQWLEQKNRIRAIAQAYYDALNANIRFCDDTASVQSPFSVRQMVSTGSGALGEAPGDFMNANPRDQGKLLSQGFVDNVETFFFEYPTAGIPITSNEMGTLWGLIVAHECGHFLGLVSQGNVLGGDAGWHNQYSSPLSVLPLRIMNKGTDDNLLDKLGRTDSWSWRLRNANYLKFVSPRQ